jgi:hypothetical protein
LSFPTKPHRGETQDAVQRRLAARVRAKRLGIGFEPFVESQPGVEVTFLRPEGLDGESVMLDDLIGDDTDSYGLYYSVWWRLS